MTVVVAVRGGDRVHMAADSWSMGVDDLPLEVDKIAVLDVQGERVLFAAAGRSALARVVRSHLKIDGLPVGDQDAWAQAVAEAVTELAVEHRLVDGDGDMDADALLAWRGHLWHVHHQCAAPVEDYFAIGCARGVALGACWVARTLTMHDPATLAKLAVGAAVAHHAAIGGQIRVASTGTVGP